MNHLDKRPGIKQHEIRKCVLCGKGVAHAGHPLFYRITIEQFGLMKDAIQRQSGLEMMLGGHAKLANIMGPDEDMPKFFLNINIFGFALCAPMSMTLYRFLLTAIPSLKLSRAPRNH
jgi:hypothetical protein